MLGIIIVEYKSTKQTIEFVLKQISKLNNDYKVVICSNEATEEAIQAFHNQLDAEIVTSGVANLNKTVFIIPSNENLGFAKGNNLGTEFLIKHFHPEYLLFSNNDIVINDPDTVNHLVAKLQANPKIGMIGPEILGLDDRRQSPEPYTSLWNRYVWMYLTTPFLSLKAKKRIFDIDYSQNAQEGFHYRLMGSFFLMRTDDFIKCGMMDPNTFLYAEEMILSERLAAIGKKAYFLPYVSVVHAHGATTGKHIPRRKGKLIQFKSDAYYYKAYRKYSDLSISLCSILYRIICIFKYPK